MYERLLDKDDKPTREAFVAHIGEASDAFALLEAYLTDMFAVEKAIKLDAHSRCWKTSYHVKRKYICDVYAEKDAFTLVTRLTEDGLSSVYDHVSTYARQCIDESAFRHSGWIGHAKRMNEQVMNKRAVSPL